jgi:hypothetical protein
MNVNFPVVESFAGSCNNICNTAGIPDNVKIACDAGSYAFCKDSKNISSANCKAFFDRTIKTGMGMETGTAYSNPVKVPASGSVSAYYKDMAKAAMDFIISKDNTLNDPDVLAVVSILKTMNTEYGNLVSSYFLKCSTDTNTPVCSADNLWLKAYVKEMTIPLTIQYLDSTKTNILDIYSKTSSGMLVLHKKYPSWFVDMEPVILSSLTRQSLSNPILLDIRDISDNLRAGIDNFIITLIAGSKEKLTSAIYTTQITNSPVLYDADIQAFLTRLAVRPGASIDPLVTLINTTNTQNISSCSTNPFNSTTCVAITKTADPTLLKGISDSTKTFCMASADNMVTPSCIDYINKNQATLDMDDVNNKMLDYCLTDKGKADTTNCKTFSSITGSGNWLSLKTANTVVKDVSGNVTDMTTVCGTGTGLSMDKCNNVCGTYPDLCVPDAAVKCSIPQYRYSDDKSKFANIENFNSDCDPDHGGCCDGPDNDLNWLWFLLGIIAILMLVGFAAAKYGPQIKKTRNFVVFTSMPAETKKT